MIKFQSSDTVPSEERMDVRAGALMEDFQDLVYPENYSPGAKRKAGVMLQLLLL